MLSALGPALAAGGIVFAIMVGWIGVQQWYINDKKRNPEDCDPTLATIQDCHKCALSALCAGRLDDTDE